MGGEPTPEEVWLRIEASELERPSVTAGTGFGRSAGLRVSGRIFAIFNRSQLVLKLPRERVAELIAAGEGSPWGPGTGKIMKEWVAVSPGTTGSWSALTAEAREFAGSG